MEKMLKSGVVLATEGCLPSALGAKLRLSNGKFTVTDGPFTEAKEIVGGFAVMRGELQSRNDRACKRLHEAGQAMANAKSGRCMTAMTARIPGTGHFVEIG